MVGVKPTYGRVSRYGLVAFASSLDQVGPFARDVRGAARVLEVIAGHDPKDATSSTARRARLRSRVRAQTVHGLRLGVPEEYFGAGLDPEVEASVRAAIAALEREGARVAPRRAARTRATRVATYYVVATAEASSNLARFDGVRYGLRVEAPGADLARDVRRDARRRLRPRGEAAHPARHLRALGRLLRRLLPEGAEGPHADPRATSSAAFDRGRRDRVPDRADAGVRLGEKIEDPLAMYLSDVYTLPASLAGVCALSVPVAPTPARADRPALPVGLQLIGARVRRGAPVRARRRVRGASARAAVKRLEVVAFEPRATLDALAALFERAESPCFCRYWHFEGDKNAWLDRCANRPRRTATRAAGRRSVAGSAARVVAPRRRRRSSAG